MTSWLSGRHPDPETLDELLDDAPEDQSAHLDQHVAACARCQAELARLRVARSTLRHARELHVELPDGLADRLATMFTPDRGGLASIDDSPPVFDLPLEARVQHDELAKRRRSRLLPALAVAATVAAVAIGGGYTLLQQQQPTMTAGSSEAADRAGELESGQAGGAPPSQASKEYADTTSAGSSASVGPTALALSSDGDLNPDNLQATLKAQDRGGPLGTLPASSGAENCARKLGLLGYTGYGATWKGEPAMLFATSFAVGSRIVIVDGGCQLGESGVGFHYQTEVK